MANKTASGLPTLERWNDKKCLTILDLVHKYGNWVFWFSALQILYLHLPCTLDRGGCLRNASTKKNKSLLKSNFAKKNSMPVQGM